MGFYTWGATGLAIAIVVFVILYFAGVFDSDADDADDNTADRIPGDTRTIDLSIKDVQPVVAPDATTEVVTPDATATADATAGEADGETNLSAFDKSFMKLGNIEAPYLSLTQDVATVEDCYDMCLDNPDCNTFVYRGREQKCMQVGDKYGVYAPANHQFSWYTGTIDGRENPLTAAYGDWAVYDNNKMSPGFLRGAEVIGEGRGRFHGWCANPCSADPNCATFVHDKVDKKCYYIGYPKDARLWVDGNDARYHWYYGGIRGDGPIDPASVSP